MRRGFADYPAATCEQSHRTQEGRHLRVLLVNKFYFPLGGTETCFFQLQELLRQNHHSVLVFSTRDPRNLRSPQSPFFVEKIDYNAPDIPLGKRVKFGLRLIYSFDAARKIDALLQKDTPDIAHLHNICHQLSPSILPVLRRHGIPIVQTLHDLKLICPGYRMLSPRGVCERCRGGGYYNAILQRCIKGSLGFSALNCVEAYFHKAIGIYDIVDLFISPSAFHKNKLTSFGCDQRKIRVLPNFVKPDPAPSLGPGSYVLYCGRLGGEKGLLTLVRALRSEPDISLVIAGAGPEETALRKFVRNNRMNNVRFVGFVTGEEKTRLMREARFFVVPSECYENCSLSVLEAFAHGKPVVGARIGGIPEQVQPGVNGLLFESGNAEDLREKIRRLYFRLDDVIEMGKNAWRKARDVYSPDAHYRNLMKIYGEAIARRRRKGLRKNETPQSSDEEVAH
jgi:glycosyltransferase involved in cell wall biosynthesis